MGTRFILLLAQHPLLELVAVGASEKSADKKILRCRALEAVDPNARTSRKSDRTTLRTHPPNIQIAT